MDQAARQSAAAGWFRDLRDRLCMAFELIESTMSPNPAHFERKAWRRPGEEEHRADAGAFDAGTLRHDNGGGEMSILRGQVFEKAGVNISTVHGTFSPDFRKQIPGADGTGAFWAAGISVVVHPRSPLIPAVHMNTRFIVTEKAWFGGGADLTPMLPDTDEAAADGARFHAALRAVCDRHDTDYYDRFSRACAEYFFLPHRKEPRGTRRSE